MQHASNTGSAFKRFEMDKSTWSTQNERSLINFLKGINNMLKVKPEETRVITDNTY